MRSQTAKRIHIERRDDPTESILKAFCIFIMAYGFRVGIDHVRGQIFKVSSGAFHHPEVAPQSWGYHIAEKLTVIIVPYHGGNFVLLHHQR